MLNTRQLIQRRYIVALVLIASVLTLSYVLMYRQISRNAQDGYIINISGMQRMLSQRIALLASELAITQNAETASDLASKLFSAHAMMKANQAAINANNEIAISSELNALYHGEGQLDQQVTDYLALSQRVIDAFRTDPEKKPPQLAASRQLALIARNGFLQRLDAAVFQYQREYEQRINDFQRKELSFLVLGLVILVLEVIFIFRPMAQEVDSAMSQLEGSNSELREFAYRISHDLRAPVASSIGMADLVRDSLDDQDTDSATEGITRIKTAMIRLDELISDVITVTKNRHTDEDPEPIHISRMVAEIIESLAELPGYDRIEFTQAIDQEIVLKSKPMFLRQSLENLISNAIKYSDVQEEHPKITVAASVSDSDCEISVRDNGIGIPEASRDHIFGMFKRFHPRQSFGSGLGLYLVKQNIAKLSGTIHYQPLEKGTAFMIQIPRSLEEI
jgi:signal transduction histidine kinase